MRRLQGTFVLLFIMIAALKGQPSFGYRLVKDLVDIPGRDFYIAQVLDATPDTVQGPVRYEGEFKWAKMKDGLKEGLTKYFSKALLKKEGMEPVVLRVCGLYLSEESTLASEEAHVWLWVEFYRHEGERLKFEYDAETILTGARYREVSRLHESLIRNAFRDVMNQYVQFLKGKQNGMSVKFTERAVSRPPKGVWEYSDYHERYKHFPVEILDLSFFSGVHSMGGEVHYQHYFEGRYRPVRFPLVMSVGSWSLKETNPGESGSMFYLSPGAGIMFKLDPLWSCNIEGSLPLGVVQNRSPENGKQSGFLYGGMLRQSIFFQPREKQRWGLKVTGYEHFWRDNISFKKDFGIGLGLVYLLE